MEKEKLIELFKDSFGALTTRNKVYVHSEFVRGTNRYDDDIFFNDEEFFEENFGKTMDAVRAVSYGKYKYTDEYIWFDGYGNLETGTYENELPLSDEDEMAEWFTDGNHDVLSYISGMEDFVEACNGGEDEENENE